MCQSFPELFTSSNCGNQSIYVAGLKIGLRREAETMHHLVQLMEESKLNREQLKAV
jgi:hypothetical protein